MLDVYTSKIFFLKINKIIFDILIKIVYNIYIKRKEEKNKMINTIKTLGAIVLTLIIGWFVVSYFDIIANQLTGVHHSWNFFWFFINFSPLH